MALEGGYRSQITLKHKGEFLFFQNAHFGGKMLFIGVVKMLQVSYNV
jgi:hypothetical protein